jgi:5'-methylthioadenosine/S-adenosylhomocysteine nucleosidase
MKNYLVLTAMDSEFKDVISDMEFIQEKNNNFEYQIWKKRSFEKNISVTRTGVGPINAAINLSLLLEKEHFDEVILLGLGGGIDPSLCVGDVVIASSVVQHDAICSFDDREELMACGELHLSLPEEKRMPIFMSTSINLNDKYFEYLTKGGFRVHSGIVASGSEFVGSIQKKTKIAKMIPGALLVDMEACSISYICKKKEINFSIIKTVADTLTRDATKEYINCIQSNSLKCANIVKCIDKL